MGMASSFGAGMQRIEGPALPDRVFSAHFANSSGGDAVGRRGVILASSGENVFAQNKFSRFSVTFDPIADQVYVLIRDPENGEVLFQTPRVPTVSVVKEILAKQKNAPVEAKQQPTAVSDRATSAPVALEKAERQGSEETAPSLGFSSSSAPGGASQGVSRGGGVDTTV